MKNIQFRILVTVILVILLPAGPRLMAQNQVDQQGRKTGSWKVDYPNGRTLYEATFVEGRPVGLMTRYYENGAVRAKMEFEAESDRSYTIMYYKNRKPAAEGWYAGKVKDSVWTYYSEFDGTVRIREPYENGVLHGKVLSYYPDGEVSEEVPWDQNRKSGIWKQFYKDGSLRVECSYENDLLNGLYQVYYSDGTVKVTGTLQDNLSHGNWIYFDEEGVELYSIEFNKGIAVDQEKYLEIMQDTLERFEFPDEPESRQHF